MTVVAHQQYTHRDIHHRLVDRAYVVNVVTPAGGAQALHCPYYVPLEGVLGADWGIIVNPLSTRFAQLTYEHNDCGCPKSPHEDAEGFGRHLGSPSQDGDMWRIGWTHVCDDDCSDDCEFPSEVPDA